MTMSSPQDDGREMILDLVNRFYRQLRHGCQNRLCNTPTCMSCRKRRGNGPFRRFTVLTARALATFLAGEDGAERKLCPHRPAIDSDPDDRAFPTDQLAESPLMREVFHVHGQDIYNRIMVSQARQPSIETNVLSFDTMDDSIQTLQKLESKVDLLSVSNTSSVRSRENMSTFIDVCGDSKTALPSETFKQSVTSSTKRRSGAEKDSKSFTQNLYDTEIFKALEIVEIQNGYQLSLKTKKGKIKGDKSDWKIPGNYRFRKMVDAELLTHPLLTTAWEEIGDVFLTERNIRHNPNVERLNDLAAAQVVMKAFSTLTLHLPLVPSNLRTDSWELFISLRKIGQFVPNGNSDRRLAEPVLQLMDSYGDELALRLMVRLTRAFASRRCWSLASACTFGEVEDTFGDGIRFSVFVRHIIGIISIGMNRSEMRGAGVVLDSVSYLDDPATVGRPLLESSTRKVGWIGYASAILEWLRGVIIHEWDGKAEFQRFSAVGGAIDLMECFYKTRNELGLSSEVFCTPFVSNRLDSMEMPINWLSFRSSRNSLHILSFPFLFTPATLVTYFRSINYAIMAKAYESSWATFTLYQRMNHLARDPRIQEKLKTATNSYLVLDIRRHSLLSDALDQLWWRQKRELMRPLKVRMGMDEGEEGVDHGGVQQEFFRIALGQALDPDYGLFTTDSRTRMSWFRPCSLEHSFKFELLGLLTSLAVYNGVTLPVTFPLALYRKLLGMPVTDLSDIEDGWPELAKGLQELLSWSDGAVEDVFVRSYIFAVETVSGVINIDMEREGRDSNSLGGYHEDNKVNIARESRRSAENSKKMHNIQLGSEDSTLVSNDGSDEWVNLDEVSHSPSESEFVHIGHAHNFNTAVDGTASEANMVTNENREQYVKDYIFWLTEKSVQPQYKAFARGFYICLDKKALSIFTPEALQNVVEGNETIDVSELQSATKYENGYSADHSTIKDFWFVVRSFSEDQLRKLLEFVTASDRVPVKGASSMTFLVQRNGTDDDRLPTSLTCFGRLLLPEYSSRKKLQEKLCLAIENSQGFGVP